MVSSGRLLIGPRKMKQKEVASIFGVKPHTGSKAIEHLEETGGHASRTGQGRRRKARDEVHVGMAEEYLKSITPSRDGETGNSTRKLGKKLRISHKLAHRILKDDLVLTPWKKVIGQKLKQKEQRLNKAKAPKERFAGDGHRRILSTGEKFFPIEEAHNPQND